LNIIGEEGLADMSVQPKNPITMAYQSHDSPIYSVIFSPFNRHLFLTSAHDGQMRIYSQLFVKKIIFSLKKSNSVFSQILDVVLHQHKARYLLVVGHHHVHLF
jgi:WD40 repeat protein